MFCPNSFPSKMIPDAEFDASLFAVLSNILPAEIVERFFLYCLGELMQVQTEAYLVGVNLTKHDAFRVLVVKRNLVFGRDLTGLI